MTYNVFHHTEQRVSYALPMVLRTHQHIVKIGIHHAVVHGTNHPHKFVSVPRRKDCAEIPHRRHQFIGIVPRRPLNRKEQVFQVLFHELVYLIENYNLIANFRSISLPR